AAGRAGGAGGESGVTHLALAPSADAADAVLTVLSGLQALSGLQPADGQAVVCLPGPRTAVRPLLAAGWRVAEFDLYMATEPGGAVPGAVLNGRAHPTAGWRATVFPPVRL